jgi:hypothetical protein
MKNLSMNIAEIDSVEVDESQSANSRSGKIDGYGASESARTHDQNSGLLELPLALLTDSRQQDLPAVPFPLIVRHCVIHRDGLSPQIIASRQHSPWIPVYMAPSMCTMWRSGTGGEIPKNMDFGARRVHRIH